MLLFLAFLVLRVGVNFILFRQEQENKKSKKFLTSERMLVFIIEILIAVIGFGITLAVTNANELQVEKDKAICMLEQTIEFTENQISREKKYLNMYKEEKIEMSTLLLSSVISMDYYDNVLSNEVLLQNANMNTYGEIMRYLSYVEYYDDSAKTEEDESKAYSKMYNRCSNMKKVKELLTVCCDEMSGEITAEEAAELCKEIKYGDDADDNASKNDDSKDNTTKATE